MGAAFALLGGVGPAGAASPTSPPPLSILTTNGDIGAGDIFITPTGDTGTYANGPEIIDGAGHVAFDGQRVLTWWQGTGLGGLSSGTDYIDNDRYQPIATVNAGNGLSADGHEFLITPWNTALILSYTTATADLTSIGGPPTRR
jgi:hypothetical protein